MVSWQRRRGNVLALITDNVGMVEDSVWATVVSVSDYYPFGLEMKGRTWSDTTARYRYGFNGYEADNEISGTGNSYTTQYRQYDPRTGRWKSLDPKMYKYPSMSPYSAYGNNPILIIDLEGDVLKVHGGAKEVTKFKAILDKTFAGEVELKIAEDGTVTLHGDRSKLGKNDQALYDMLNTIIADEKTTDVVLLNEDQRSRVMIGGWRAAKVGDKPVNAIDLYDAEMFKSGNLSPEAFISHELWETYQDQVKGKGVFEDAHNEALKKQGDVDGVYIYGNFRTSETTAITMFIKGENLYTTEREIKDNNITKVTQKEGWTVPSLDKEGETVTLKTTDDLTKYQERAKELEKK